MFDDQGLGQGRPFPYEGGTYLRPQVETDSRFHGADGDRWVVVLEYAARDGHFCLEDVFSLVEALDSWDASGLFSPDFYSVQLQVSAGDPLTAVWIARAEHDTAREGLVPSARLVRADVLLVSEMERGWDSQSRLDAAGGGPLGAATIPREVYQSTRSLLAASTSAEITAELLRFVTAVGRFVRIGSHLPSVGEIGVDLGIADGPPVTAIAESLSVAGLFFEQYLPTLVQTAAPPGTCC